MPVEWLDDEETQPGGFEWLDDDESDVSRNLSYVNSLAQLPGNLASSVGSTLLRADQAPPPVEDPLARGPWNIPARTPTAGIVTDISNPPMLPIEGGANFSAGPFHNEVPMSPQQLEQGRLRVEKDRIAEGRGDPLEQGGIGSQAWLGLLQALPMIGEQAWGDVAGGLDLVDRITPDAIDYTKPLRAPIQEFAGERAASKAEDVAALETIGKATSGPQFVRPLVASAGSMLPVMGAAGGGLPAMAIASGLQSYGAAFSQAKEQGLSDGEAQQDALVKGAITTLVTRGFGATGAEVLANPATRTTIKKALVDFFKQAGMEATEESTDETLSTAYDFMVRDPDMDIATAIERVFGAGLAGSILGGGVSAGRSTVGAVTDRGQAVEPLPAGQSALSGAPLKQGTPNAVPIIPAQAVRSGVQEPAQSQTQGQTQPVEGVRTDAARGQEVDDFDRYNAIAKEFSTATPDRQQEIFSELDAIKNRHGNQPPRDLSKRSKKFSPNLNPSLEGLTDVERIELPQVIKENAKGDPTNMENVLEPGATTRTAELAILSETSRSSDPARVIDKWGKRLAGLREQTKAQDPMRRVAASHKAHLIHEGIKLIALNGERIGASPELVEAANKYYTPPTIDEEIIGTPTPRTLNETTQETKEERVLTPEAMAEIESEFDTAKAAQPVGMGAAVPAEFDPEPSGPTSIKNKTVDKERAERGLPPAVQAARRSFGEVWDRAMSVADNDPTAQDNLIAELKSKPRALTDLEDALLLHRQVELQNEFAKATRDLAQAYEDGRPESVATEQQRVDFLSDKLLELYDVGKAAGTETGRGLSARRMMANEDFSLAAMEVQARAAKGGRPLTAEESEQLGKTQKKIAKTQEALDSHLENAGDKAAGQIIDKISKEFLDSAVDPFEQQELITAQLQAKIESGDFDISDLVQKLVRMFVATGIRKRDSLTSAVHGVLQQFIPDITVRETQDAISGYGKFKAIRKDEVSTIVRDLKGQLQQVAKLDDIMAKRPLKKTGVERRVPSDEERRLIQQVNEAKRKYGVVVTDPATQLRSALQSAKTFLTHRLADLRQEISARERNVKTKTPLKADAELEALRAEYELVKKEHAAIFPPRKITDAQRIELANRALDRSIAKLESDLAAGKLKPDKAVSKTPETPGLLEKRAWLEALRQHRKELLDAATPKLSPEERAIQSLKSRLTRSIAEYERRLRVGDFTPRAKTAVDISKDPKAIELKAENERLKAQFKRGLEIDRLKRRTTAQKVYAGVKETLNLPRNILSSWDVSAVLRQGGFIAFGNPVRAAKSIGPMFKALASEKAALETEQQILNRPNAPLYARSKLYLAPSDSIRLSVQEEQIMSRMGNKIPGVRASNRAFTTFLNKLRADSFDAMVDNLTKSGEATPAELSAISNYINVATGRGAGIGKGAETLATVFFSPRLLASRFQLVAGQPLYYGSARTRKAVATEYAKFLTGMGVFYALGVLAGGDLEEDPRSADFGKIRFGSTRVDPLAGLAQVTTLISRIVSGETKTISGDVRPIRGEDIPFGGGTSADVAARFLRTKLTPIVGTAVDVASGENVVGEPVTPISTAANLTVPLSFRDILDVMEEQGVAKGTALEILSLFGVGLQHYDENK